MEQRRILYLGYWGSNDVLTASSVFPTLRALSETDMVSQVVYCSIERNGHIVSPTLPPKVVHVPLISTASGNVLITKLRDFTKFPRTLRKLIDEYKINIVIARSALAGGMVLSVTRRKRIPLIIESFEPHADYMVESLIWKSFDPRTWLSHRMESKLKRQASWLLPVSENYHKHLLKEKVSPQLAVVPCTVDINKFSFNPEHRNSLRKEWNWKDLTIGVYVGKFGGIYYEAEAFEQFRAAFSYFGSRFALIILTSQEDVETLIRQYLPDISSDRLRILSVPHDKVMNYLSAADFAFSTIKPAPSRRFCSPIKHGEYWASGLPIILEDGIGDDSDIIRIKGGGVILERPNYREAFDKIDAMIIHGRTKNYEDIRSLAIKYRSEELLRDAYNKIL
jgi:glycosyltransferase involved in cell wall biosynthesis